MLRLPLLCLQNKTKTTDQKVWVQSAFYICPESRSLSTAGFQGNFRLSFPQILWNFLTTVFPSHSPRSLFCCHSLCECVRDSEKERERLRERQRQRQKHGGQRLSVSMSLCVSLGWQPCVRVSALCSRWPSQLLPGSPGSQHSLTRAGVLTAWGPADTLLGPGLWGLWGLRGALWGSGVAQPWQPRQ